MTTPNDDELCQRLRQVSTDFHLPPSIQSMRNIRAIDAAGEAATRIEALTAERDAAVALLTEITPSRLIGESHVPYPEGKTTILMSWDWLRRARAIERGDHITEAKPIAENG